MICLIVCLKPEYVLVLQDILNYHYTYGKFLADELSTGQVITMANGKDITVSIGRDVVFINEDSLVIAADVMATNGVIHAIDTVLVPPDVDVAGFLDMCLATDPPVPAPTTPPTPAPQPEPTPEPTIEPTMFTKSSKKSTDKSKKSGKGKNRNRNKNRNNNNKN